MTTHATRILHASDSLTAGAAIAEGARLLLAGELVAFPTETVYGLGADAASPAAVAKVFEAKGRPADNPLIVHLASADDLPLACESVEPRVLALARAFWPGPLTLVLRARPGLRGAACRGLDTVAVRVPDHPVALALIAAAGIPVAAPSANRSGRPSPTRAEDVMRDLGGRIPLILDGGPCRIGLESTVLDLSHGEPAILRPGAVTAAQIEKVLGVPVQQCAEGEALKRSPGTRYRHYAPRAPVLLLGPGVSDAAALRLLGRLGSAGYVGTRPALRSAPGVTAAAPAAHPGDLARSLYAALRDLDDAGVDVIVADAVAEDGLGQALMDRLRRAATMTVESDADADSAA